MRRGTDMRPREAGYFFSSVFSSSFLSFLSSLRPFTAFAAATLPTNPILHSLLAQILANLQWGYGLTKSPIPDIKILGLYQTRVLYIPHSLNVSGCFMGVAY